ncbi:MAG: transketolase [Bacteroidetes bacterium]|nr:transketolase [Bacteroidota bacterium]MBK9046530.1 transketolase [Bacteroidota bacterium]MBK9425124.1 transketolase [Bacteroidota bacterium]
MTKTNTIAKNIRRSILQMNHRSNASHSGSALSIVELLTVLYFKYLNIDPKEPKNDKRDRFILSKGHASSALYSVLAEKGFFPKTYLDKFYIDNGILPGHVDKDAAPGLECAAGSLGHGLSIGVGMAIASKYKKHNSKVVVLISDGELNEGSIWEPLLLAPHLNLNNLTVIIDYNKIQSFGLTNEIVNLEPLSDKLIAFNWDVFEIDGHNFEEIETALNSKSSKPKIIIAHTIKGKGVSFMENKLEWHYRSPNDELLKKALAELK